MRLEVIVCITALTALLASHSYGQQPTGGQLPAPSAVSDTTNKFTTDKQGRATMTFTVERAEIDSKVYEGMKNTLVLYAPTPQVTMEAALKNPALRDQVEVRLSPAVQEKLKGQGIKDLSAHFRSHTVHATGKLHSMLYLCFPAVAVNTIVVDRLEDIQLLPAPAKQQANRT